MNEHDIVLSRFFRVVGHDGTETRFATPSWTRNGIEHEQWIDWETGIMRCSCEDAVCRKKVGDVLSDQPQGCKHIWALAKLLGFTVKNKA